MFVKNNKFFQQGSVSYFLIAMHNEIKHCLKVESKMIKLHHYVLLEFEDLFAYIYIHKDTLSI
jgi:hypothetical protein